MSTWKIEHDRTNVVCPDCAFSFDAIHQDGDGGYTCPLCEPAPASGEPSGAEAVVREALRDCEEVLRLIHEAAGPVPKDAPMPRTTSWGAWKAAREALGLPTAPEEGESDAE